MAHVFAYLSSHSASGSGNYSKSNYHLFQYFTASFLTWEKWIEMVSYLVQADAMAICRASRKQLVYN